jgi:hypothetical protein
MKGKLNLFQAAIVRWREMHPYNAVHVVRVVRPLDASRLETGIRRRLEELGLTGLGLDRRRLRYEWSGGASAATVAILAGGADPLATLHGEIERQLNLAFPAEGRLDPFRFFVVVVDETSFHLGIAYDHFVAGGDSIVLLLQRFVEDYCGIEHSGPASPHPALYPPKYRRLFARQAIPLVKGLASLRGLVASCRRSVRPSYARSEDGYNGVAFFRLDSNDHAHLVRTARDWDMTQNDLFLSILLWILSPRVAERRQAKRRRELAVASIVNVRRDFGAKAANGFAPLLASFRIAHPVPPGMELRELASFVHAETSRVKRGKLYLQTLLAIGLSGLQWRFLSVEQRQRFHTKNYAVWAGVTPLQLDALWPAARTYPFRVEYVRAVPTGPLSPIVVALTTLGEVVQIALSFRTAALDRERVDGITADIIHCIRSL